MCFNLLDAPWIPIVRSNGKPDKVGILKVLAEAGAIREVCAASPLDTAAVYRFLLAVLQWSKPDPKGEDIERERTENGFQALLGKLDDNKGRFELLGERHGFYQSPAYQQDIGPPATALIPELPSGSSVAHFRHTRDLRDGLCPACCALALIRLSAFAPSGTHPARRGETRFKAGKPAGINGVTPVYGIPLGETLFDTLLLNWPMRVTAGDRPGWLSDDPPYKSQIGCLAALTWRPRGIWLERPEDAAAEDRCSYCGDKGRLIHRIAFVPGWRQPFPREKRWPCDPHFLLQIEDSQSAPVRFPNPDQRTDLAARSWRRIYRAILQGLASAPDEKTPAQHRHVWQGMERSGRNCAVTVACFGPAADPGRVALYKDGSSLSLRLPRDGLDPESAKKAIAELDQLNQLDLRRVLRTGLRRRAMKPQDVTSALADAAVKSEWVLRKSFDAFIEALAASCQNALDEWRKAAHGCLGDQLRRALGVLRKGSALRKMEQESCLSREFVSAFARFASSQAQGGAT